MSHSPAPWQSFAFTQQFSKVLGCFWKPVYSCGTDENGEDAEIAPARAYGSTMEECEANAALIAVAPELLGLLKDIELALKAGNLRKPNQWRDRISAVIRKTQVAA